MADRTVLDTSRKLGRCRNRGSETGAVVIDKGECGSNSGESSFISVSLFSTGDGEC